MGWECLVMILDSGGGSKFICYLNMPVFVLKTYFFTNRQCRAYPIRKCYSIFNLGFTIGK
jgi:hypothetical protein